MHSVQDFSLPLVCMSKNAATSEKGNAGFMGFCWRAVLSRQFHPKLVMCEHKFGSDRAWAQSHVKKVSHVFLL